MALCHRRIVAPPPLPAHAHVVAEEVVVAVVVVVVVEAALTVVVVAVVQGAVTTDTALPEATAAAGAQPAQAVDQLQRLCLCMPIYSHRSR